MILRATPEGSICKVRLFNQLVIGSVHPSTRDYIVNGPNGPELREVEPGRVLVIVCGVQCFDHFVNCSDKFLHFDDKEQAYPIKLTDQEGGESP
jgi:hypothetical protein